MQAAILQLGSDSGGPFAQVGLFPDGVAPHQVDAHGTPINLPVGTPFVVRPQAGDYAGTDGLTGPARAQAVIQALIARGLGQAAQAAAVVQHQQELAQAAAAYANQTFPVPTG